MRQHLYTYPSPRYRLIESIGASHTGDVALAQVIHSQITGHFPILTSAVWVGSATSSPSREGYGTTTRYRFEFKSMKVRKAIESCGMAVSLARCWIYRVAVTAEIFAKDN